MRPDHSTTSIQQNEPTAEQQSDVAEAPGPAAALAYDELPEGSELRREYDDRGGVTITAPAGELPPAVRRAAARTGVGAAGAVCGACLLVGGLVLLRSIRGNLMDPPLRAPAFIALGVLSVGVFLLVWRVRSAARVHVLSEARRQATVLHADAERLLVETTGPGQPVSLDIATAQITLLQVGGGSAGRRPPAEAVPCVQVLLRDGTSVHLLPGHHDAELRWVAGSLSEAIRATQR